MATQPTLTERIYEGLSGLLMAAMFPGVPSPGEGEPITDTHLEIITDQILSIDRNAGADIADVFNQAMREHMDAE